MAPLKVGEKFPSGVKFDYVKVTDLDPTICGIPTVFDADKEFAGKKVVIVSVPGAFTPTCSVNHIPPYISNIEELHAKGVDLVVIIATNDAWVMNAWAKVNKVKRDDILFVADTKTQFGENHGFVANPQRNGRFAVIVEKDGTVSYIENEPKGGQVTVSGVEAVLSKL